MHNAAQAYASTAKAAKRDQREIEADAFMRAAAMIQAARDAFPGDERLVDEALELNKRVWAMILPAIVEKDNPLPSALKGNLVSLGIFVFKRMDEFYEKPRAEALDILVTINADIAAGLRGQAAP